MAEPGQDFGGFVSSSPESLFLSLLSYKITPTVKLSFFFSHWISQFVPVTASSCCKSLLGGKLKSSAGDGDGTQLFCLLRVVKAKHPASASH